MLLSGKIVKVARDRDMSEVVVRKYVVRPAPEKRARLEDMICKGKHSAALILRVPSRFVLEMPERVTVHTPRRSGGQLGGDAGQG